MKKMNPEWKAKWIAALRSGAYPQTDQVLRTDDGAEQYSYCCLGVLQDLVTGDFSDRPESGLMSDEAARIAGLPVPRRHDTIQSITEVPASNLQRILAEMNDEGMNFAEIAYWIERKL